MAVMTLVLGAGLGKEYGFPDGPELRQLIINELEDHDRELREIFRWSPAETVDEIASRYPQYADQIRRITTKILRDRENEHPLEQNSQPNTYKQMLRQMANAKVKGHEVNVITFNYDRSLPYLLHKINSVEIDERKIEPKVIRHVYGRLAPMWFEDHPTNQNRKMTYHEYGDLGSTPEEYNADYWQNQCVDDLCRSSSIFFIGEQKAPKQTELQTLMEKSEQIFFLGVGYHKANMEILGIDLSTRHPQRLIAGTGFGLSDDHIKALLEVYPAIDVIEQCNAYTFLRTKFDLSDPSSNLKKKSVSTLDVL